MRGLVRIVHVLVLAFVASAPLDGPYLPSESLCQLCPAPRTETLATQRAVAVPGELTGARAVTRIEQRRSDSRFDHAQGALLERRVTLGGPGPRGSDHFSYEPSLRSTAVVGATSRGPPSLDSLD